jgi:colanic acid/amylovoran biosynthesis glycosyltransferase
MKEKLPSVVHLVTPYLFRTGSWVYSQLTAIRCFENTVFTQKKENLELFPLKNVYGPEDFGAMKKFSNLLYRRITGKYGLHFRPLVKAIRPILFHAHMGFEAVRWLDFVKRTGRPMITTFYGLDVSKLGRMKEWQDRYVSLFEHGALFLAEGSYLRQQLIELGCPSQKAVVQHLGVPVDQYPHKLFKTNKPNARVVVLQVATFREKKGIEYSIQAVAKALQTNPQIELRIIGKGDSPEADSAISGLIDRLQLKDHVKLLGTTSHADTIQEMLNADIFLHPSVTASDGDNEGGAPVGIIEASAIGLPVVSTYHADIPEVVHDKTTGYLVPERDADSLAERLLDLVGSPERRALFGSEGRKHVGEEYNLKTQMEKLESIYSRIGNGS